MLSLILQRVRELAGVQLGGVEAERHKILTPFPPSQNDFGGFTTDDLAFNDRPADGQEASDDTMKAFEFFERTNSLFYDYSYGIKSEDYSLTQVCQRFFREGLLTTDDPGFEARFTEIRDLFVHKSLRSTAGDLGQLTFRYTSPSPIQWAPVVIDEPEVERLREKALTVYQGLEVDDQFLGALLSEIQSCSFSGITFELGSFDVQREWIDPLLFESAAWRFREEPGALYGDTDDTFAENDVKLCYAQRYYVIRNVSVTQKPAFGGARPRIVERPRVTTGERSSRVQRRRVRNQLLKRRVVRLDTGNSSARRLRARAGYRWVEAASGVPGHWEREHSPTTSVMLDPTVCTIAAVKCRIIPQRAPGQGA